MQEVPGSNPGGPTSLIKSYTDQTFINSFVGVQLKSKPPSLPTGHRWATSGFQCCPRIALFGSIRSETWAAWAAFFFGQLSSGGGIFDFSYMDDAHHAHGACEHPCVGLHLSSGHVPYASHNPHNTQKPAFTRTGCGLVGALVSQNPHNTQNSLLGGLTRCCLLTTEIPNYCSGPCICLGHVS